MRRQFALALGSCFAVTAVGLAQVGTTARPAQTVRYASPFVVAPQRADVPENAEMIEVAPASAARAVPANVQYIPVQAVQTGNTIQYVPMQAMPAPVAQPAAQAMQIMPVASQQIAVENAAPMMQMVPAANNPAMTVQYVPVQPMQSGLSSTATGMTPLNPVPVATAQPMVSTPTRTIPSIQYVQVQPAQGAKTQAATTAQPAKTQAGQSCANNACGQPTCEINAGPCGPCGQMWISGEYLLWWANGTGVPPLVTSSPAGTPRNQAGVIGAPGTTVLFGDDQLNDGNRSGFRLRAGMWLDCCRTCGIEGSYFFLGDSTDEFNGTATGRPFFNANTGMSDAELIEYPGVVTGRINVKSTSSLNGFDINARKNISCDPCRRLDAIVGFRYLNLDDDLNIYEDLTSTDPTSIVPPGTRFQVADSFQTSNEFYGAQFGLAGEQRRGQYFLSWRGLIGLGTTSKEVTIDGSTIITQPGGAPTRYAGGLLALPTNIGRYKKNDFAVVPEIGINAGYQFSESLRVFVGYSFIYWSNVTRVGDVIDPVVNPTQLPPGTLTGPARPAFAWNCSDFWAQGVSFGAEWRY